MVQTIAGLIFMREGEWTEALKACHKGATMEQHAICVQAYLGMERLDKAQEQVAAMEAIDEESILTQVTPRLTRATSGTEERRCRD